MLMEESANSTRKAVNKWELNTKQWWWGAQPWVVHYYKQDNSAKAVLSYLKYPSRVAFREVLSDKQIVFIAFLLARSREIANMLARRAMVTGSWGS